MRVREMEDNKDTIYVTVQERRRTSVMFSCLPQLTSFTVVRRHALKATGISCELENLHIQKENNEIKEAFKKIRICR
jgi:hypothetical protein